VSPPNQVFNAIVVSCTRTVHIRFLRREFDRQVNVTQSFDLGLQHAAEENESRYLPQKIGVLVDLLHSIKELSSAFSAVARVIGLAAVAIENAWPAWVMHQTPRPATSTSPADPSALTIRRPLPGANPAAISKSVSPHRNRSRSPRNVVRTRSVGILSDRAFRIDPHLVPA
jgi:hypothetical protein